MDFPNILVGKSCLCGVNLREVEFTDICGKRHVVFRESWSFRKVPISFLNRHWIVEHNLIDEIFLDAIGGKSVAKPFGSHVRMENVYIRFWLMIHH